MNTQRLKDIIDKHDFTLASWTPLSEQKTLSEYKKWIDRGFGGEMNYLEEHYPLKCDPAKLLEKAQSAILIAQNYYPHPEASHNPLKHARTALYAQGQDYHFWLKKRLEDLKTELEAEFQEANFLSFTDSLPILERDLGAAAGLGWIGKNTCLINEKKGSLFFIGGLLTTLSLPAQAPAPDRCGTCTRCIDSCPTDAFAEPRVLDATKCISYLNIEAKAIPNQNLRKSMGDWLFGCDICQTVCPWNTKIWKNSFDSSALQELENDEGLENELRKILLASNRQLQKMFKGSPLTRPGKRIKRTAIIVAANKKLFNLKSEIEKLKENIELTELCEWALKELNAK